MLHLKKKVTMGGYGTYVGFLSATRTSGEGVHDRLHVSSVVLQYSGKSVAVASVDSIGISSSSLARIKDIVYDACECQMEVIVSATHTHAAPDTFGVWGALPFFTGRNQSYMEYFEKQISHSIVDAYLSRKPGKIKVASGIHQNSSSDRVELPAVDEFTVNYFYDLQDKLLGTLTQWSAHPTVLGSKNNTISADFIGPFRYFMSEKLEGIHIYVNGALGWVYPGKAESTVLDPFLTGDRDPHVTDGYEKMAFHGKALANSVLRVSPTEVSINELQIHTSLIDFPNENKIFRAASLFGLIETPKRGSVFSAEVVLVKLGL